jgi:hypothetical protein
VSAPDGEFGKDVRVGRLASLPDCSAAGHDIGSRHGETQAPRQTAVPVQALRNTRVSRRLRMDGRRVSLLPSIMLVMTAAITMCAFACAGVTRFDRIEIKTLP